ncbi:Putative type-1 restriction enzyme specificity protein [Mariniflexile rhizosphaerae]|uniref:restriction endonuclease subunit S n=1 Tax=unclassified Mariniflexile TaxID=2643887 RepID=UPI000E336797|nr:restriction endonuclease subunit S [Mariniflexile sp. TRM1-10]AXP79729.1 Putative type-1 restriction enzyme specificity protein [Mariniflexile sp. TRM1-10]
MANKKLKVGNVPNLRFPGFTEEWETKKLGEITIINPKNENLPISFVYIDLESVVNGCLLKEERILKDEAPSRAQRGLTKGDILFQMVRPYQKNNLFFDKEGDYVASTGYAQIRTLHNSQFVFQYLHNQKFVDKVIERCTGTSYPAINSSDLGNIRIHYPNSQEQSKIANFLELLDNRIQTQNKIIEGLKLLKQTLIKKIFSQQLRFKDDNGSEFSEWSKKKLNEIGRFYVGGDLEKLDYQKEKTYKYCHPIYANGAGLGLYGYASTAQYPKNSVTVSGRGNLGVANVRHEEFNAIVRLIVIVPKSEISSKYLEEAINDINFVIESTGVPQLTVPQISKYSIKIPCLKEQIKIADFLSSIDSKIDIESRLRQKLEEQKKFLLQNLFI